MMSTEQTAQTDQESTSAESTTTDETSQSGLTPDALKAALEAARKEAASYRTRLRTLEKADEERKAASLSETERAVKAAQDAEAKATASRERMITAEIKAAAVAKGAKDLDLAAMAVRSKVEVGEDGEPTNVGDLLDALAKEKPFLFGQAGVASAGATVNANVDRSGRGETFSKAQIGAMSEADYEKNRAAIMAAAKDGRITD